MKSKKDWENEIQKIISEKVAAAVKEYREGRDSAIDDLTKVSQQLEDLENRVKTISSESAGLNLLRNADMAKRNENDRTLFSLQKHLRETRKQMDAIIEKVTVIPAYAGELFFLLKGVGDAKAKKSS